MWRNLDTENTSVPYQTLYNNRREVPGYVGYHIQNDNILSDVEKEALGLNKAMESTTQAVHQPFPDEFYQHGPASASNKHQGPLSRMVTLTHPFNPFTQQSAFCNMGAANTQ